MTASELRDRLLKVLRAEQSAQTPTHIHEDVAIAVNQAYQEIWAAPGLDYLRRRQASFVTSNGVSAYTLGQTFLKMLGPVSTAERDLIPISSKSDFSHFTARYLGADTTAAASGEPHAYHLQRLNRGDSYADPIEVQMLLTPTPTSAITVNYEAAFEPPAFDKCDLEADATLPVPHGFIETTLLPIAAYYLMSASWYMKTERQDLTAAITAQADAARRQIGLIDPQIATA